MSESVKCKSCGVRIKHAPPFSEISCGESVYFCDAACYELRLKDISLKWSLETTSLRSRWLAKEDSVQNESDGRKGGRGRKARKYAFRGKRLTTKEIAIFLRVTEYTVYKNLRKRTADEYDAIIKSRNLRV